MHVSKAICWCCSTCFEELRRQERLNSAWRQHEARFLTSLGCSTNPALPSTSACFSHRAAIVHCTLQRLGHFHLRWRSFVPRPVQRQSSLVCSASAQAASLRCASGESWTTRPSFRHIPRPISHRRQVQPSCGFCLSTKSSWNRLPV